MKIYQILDKSENSIMGDLTENNVYLTTYANYLTYVGQPSNRTHKDLVVGETIAARYSLSGESGIYHIKRIA